MALKFTTQVKLGASFLTYLFHDRLIVKKVIFGFTILFYFQLNSSVAQNIVPNGSFENFTACPLTGDKIYYATGWFQPCRWPGGYSLNQSSSSDYYSACGGLNSPYGVPKNYSGYQNAFSGDSYIGLTYLYTINGLREYAEVKLNHSLLVDTKYKLSYRVSLLDGSMFASNQFDAYFSNDSLLDVSWLSVINVVPQITNLSQAIISDTMNWVSVSGSFYANGGENYLTLGNFHSDNLTDTINVNPSSNTINAAYYYIDDVILELDTIIGIEEVNKGNFQLYPNPTTKNISIRSPQLIQELSVLDISGKIVLKQNSFSTSAWLDLTALENGIYFVQCKFKNGAESYKKMVLQKE